MPSNAPLLIGMSIAGIGIIIFAIILIRSMKKKKEGTTDTSELQPQTQQPTQQPTQPSQQQPTQPSQQQPTQSGVSQPRRTI